jgi:hypothetical protein
MVRRQKAPEKDADARPFVGDAVDIPEEVDPDEVDAFDIVNNNLYVRTYSRAVHGDDFKALAEQFCTKKPKLGAYAMVPSSQITHLEVRYRERTDADLPPEQGQPKRTPVGPIVNKTVRFDDKDEALAFGHAKKGSVVVPKKK